MSLNRREFHQRFASTAVAFGSAGLLAHPLLSAEAKPMPAKPLPIVDTHQHLWDLKRFHPPWLEGAPEVLKRSYLPSDYAQAIEGLNVVKSVYMEVDVATDEQQDEAEYVLGLCKAGKTTMVGAVISGRPGDADGFRKYILQFKGNPAIKGVRQVLHSESIKRAVCLETDFVKSMQLLGELNMSYDLCMRPGELSDGVKLADECPDTRFVLDHCGNADPAAFFAAGASGKVKPKHEADQWKNDIHELAQRKNVICKISGIVAGAPDDWDAEMLSRPINHCLDEFGPDRVVFGGDWPVCLLHASYKQWVEALLAIISSRPEAEQRKLLHDNAVRQYGLG